MAKIRDGWFRLFVGFFTLSGVSGLVYQLVWARKLQLAFGVSLYAIAAVLAAYFLGMAWGSWLGGKYSDRFKRPLLVYGLIEIGVGLSALVVTPHLAQLDVALRPFASLLGNHFFALQTGRFLLTLLLLIAPTTLLGATVPLMNRAAITHDHHIGERFATLYSANTIGATFGVLLAGFYLIEHFGLNLTVQLAAALSIFIGCIALGIAVVEKGIVADRHKTATEETHAVSSSRNSFVYVVMGVSGALGLSLEVLWTRILIQGIGSTAYIFAIVLALFLAGIAIGSYFVRKHVDRWNDLYAALALSLAGAAVFTLMGVPLLSWVMPRIVGHVVSLLQLNQQQEFLPIWAVWCTGALLPSTIALGASFPIAAKLLARGHAVVGQDIGRLFAVNTYGGVIGSIVTGFFLVPGIGLYGTICVIAAVYVLLSAGLIFNPRTTSSGRSQVAVVILLTFVAWFFLPQQLVRDRVLDYVRGKVLAYKEDYYGAIVVTQEGEIEKYKRLSVNGVSYSGTAPYAVEYMRLQGHLPMIMSSAKDKRALVICFGVGLTAGAVSTYPNTHLTVVELSKSILKLSPLFTDVNEKVYLDPSVKFVVDDGRDYLVRHPNQRFDVITLEPPPPVQVGMANLYSLNFYNLVRRRLGKNGVAIQWIPLHTQSNKDTKMLIATFAKAFPNASLWWTESGETLVLGQKDGQPLSPGHIQRMMNNPAVARSLAEIGIHDPAALASHYLLDSQGIARLTRKSRIMTDDLPVIEYRVPAINHDYKALLAEAIKYRPDSEKIASLLGLDKRQVPELDEDWNELRTQWLAARLY